MLEITRYSPRICCAAKILSVTVRQKFTKVEVMKRLMKEHKAMFGALLETKKEKTRRLKLEKKGAIARANVVAGGDSELAWMLRATVRPLRLVKMNPDCEIPIYANQKTQRKGTKERNMHSRVQKTIIRKVSQSRVRNPEITPSESAVLSDNNPEKIDNEKSGEKNSSILLPHNLLLKNISKGSLHLKGHKKAEWDSSKILSICSNQSSLPSVSHILNITKPEIQKKQLDEWKAKRVKMMGENGFNQWKSDLLNRGQLLHSVIDSSLRKIPTVVPEQLKLCFDSVKIVLDEVQDVRVLESQVVHRDLCYRGTVDCVASYRGQLCMIDWKESRKKKLLLSSTYDAPLQLVSQIGALNVDENYPFQINTGLLVIASTHGEEPTVFTLNQRLLQYFWRMWLARLEKYYTMQKDDKLAKDLRSS